MVSPHQVQTVRTLAISLVAFDPGYNDVAGSAQDSSHTATTGSFARTTGMIVIYLCVVPASELRGTDGANSRLTIQQRVEVFRRQRVVIFALVALANGGNLFAM
jgi:hypothetical protein